MIRKKIEKWRICLMGVIDRILPSIKELVFVRNYHEEHRLDGTMSCFRVERENESPFIMLTGYLVASSFATAQYRSLLFGNAMHPSLDAK